MTLYLAAGASSFYGSNRTGDYNQGAVVIKHRGLLALA
jgi:hypothetical protein